MVTPRVKEAFAPEERELIESLLAAPLECSRYLALAEYYDLHESSGVSMRLLAADTLNDNRALLAQAIAMADGFVAKHRVMACAVNRAWRANLLWEKGFGRAIGLAEFSEYLATVPPVPDFPDEYSVFPSLVLVDARVRDTQGCLDLKRICTLLGVETECYGRSFVIDQSCELPERNVYWMLAEARRGIDKIAPRPFEQYCTALEGLLMMAQSSDQIWYHGVFLPGSVVPGSDRCACIDCVTNQPQLVAWKSQPNWAAVYRGKWVG